MLRIALFSLSMLLAPSITYAKEYGKYDLNEMRTITKTASGKKYDINKQVLDPMLHDLGLHARNFPPQFDTPQDQKRAVLDVKTMSKVFDALVSEPKPNTDILMRAGYLNMIGRNLGIPGSGEKADSNFKRLLKVKPSDPDGNYLYGTFLAGENKTKKALPYLEKATAAGVTEAAYTLGLAYLKLGNKQKALEHLEAFKKSNPYVDASFMKLLDDIRNDKIKSKNSPK